MRSKRGQSAPKSTQTAQGTLETPTTPEISITALILWFTQAAIVIALITIVGYWYVLSYERGFCAYFGIPYYFILLNPSIIAETEGSWSNLFFILFTLNLAIILLATILVLIFNRISRLFKKKQVNKDEPIWLLPLKIMIAIHLIFMVVFYSFDGSTFFRNKGREKAVSQDYFLICIAPCSNNVPIKDKDMAVIRNYGENIFAVPINRDNKQFERKIVILKISEIKTYLTMEQVGPLMPEKIQPVEVKPAP
jgi:hypothetical protein